MHISLTKASVLLARLDRGRLTLPGWMHWVQDWWAKVFNKRTPAINCRDFVEKLVAWFQSTG